MEFLYTKNKITKKPSVNSDGFFYGKKWGFYLAKNKVKVVPFINSD